MPEIAAGTRWIPKRSGGHAAVVEVFRTTSNNVMYHDPLGKPHTQAIAAFLHGHTPWADRAKPKSGCERCHTSAIDPNSKYCKPCLQLISAVRTARTKGAEPLLTTTDPKLIEERRLRDEPEKVAVQPTAEPKPQANSAAVKNWRISVREIVVTEREITVEADSLLDALAQIDAVAPGMEVTDVHLVRSAA